MAAYQYENLWTSAGQTEPSGGNDDSTPNEIGIAHFQRNDNLF